MKEEIFKQNQSIRVIKIQNVNRNKEIVKYGYTGRMGEVIESYGGVRK